MELAGIVGIIGTVMNVVMKAIPFVEQLFASGTDKKAAVMNVAQIAVAGTENAILANNPNWEFMRPIVDKFIDDVIAASKAIDANQKKG